MPKLPEVLNWRRWNARITLSGQPTEDQMAQIKDLGVTRIINLGPHHNKGALLDEAGTVAGLGMEYIYIPVKFGRPSEDDFVAFCGALARQPDAQLHVHCIYNARVSAFFYRYASEGRGGDAEAAFELMDSIWRPGGAWATFIGKPEDMSLLNRYKGDEY